jgi:UDP-N-acetylglucosamine acyltransferase
MNISPLACVSENALIGKDVKIGPFVTIDENVVIGDGTIIDSNAVIHSGARIGNNCHIHSGAVVSDIPQDLKFKGEDSVAIIGDNCLIMAYCHVAHDCELGNNVIMSNQVQLAGEVVVGDYAVLGGGALVHQFTHIGKHVMLQGGSLVNKDLPPSIMAGRYPISYEGVNSVGLHRRGFTEEQITKIQKVYRVLYLSRLNNTEALAKVIAEIPQSPERDEIVNFVKASKRGIVRMGI